MAKLVLTVDLLRAIRAAQPTGQLDQDAWVVNQLKLLEEIVELSRKRCVEIEMAVKRLEELKQAHAREISDLQAKCPHYLQTRYSGPEPWTECDHCGKEIRHKKSTFKSLETEK